MHQIQEVSSTGDAVESAKSRSQPLVTVAIPTFRGARFIRAAIDSVLNQSFSDFELIVVDDNSPDETQEILAEYTDPRVFYVRNNVNLGPQGNWNKCLELGRGVYFKLLPHDDVLQPNCLKDQVAVLQADSAENIAIVFSARTVVGPDGKRVMVRGFLNAKTGVLPSNYIMRACMRRGTNLLGEPGAILFRKSLSEKIGQFDAKNPYVIDLDYWFRLLGHGAGWYSSEPLASFRVSSQQWSVVIGASQGADFRNLIDEMIERRHLMPTMFDRILGRITPTLNTVARLIFYKIYL